MGLGQVIHCVDAHAEGASRIVVGGVLDVPGETMLEKMRHLEGAGDALRRRLLFEPRRSAPLSLDLVLPSSHPRADAGFIVMESCSYEGMSGTNTINTATVLLETGMLPMAEPLTRLTLEAPAGLVGITADCHDGRCERVTLKEADEVRQPPSGGLELKAELAADPQVVLQGLAQLGHETPPGHGWASARSAARSTLA